MKPARKRARGFLDSINTIDVEIDLMDRISQLPDQVLVHIASFLPSTCDLVHLSAVSKSWYRSWTSSPIWNFSESSLYHKKEFLSFVQNNLLKQYHHNKKMDRFRLEMLVRPADSSVVDHLIELALHSLGAKNLDLSFHSLGGYAYDYCLPQTIFCAKELNVLYLTRNCRMKLPQGHNPSPRISWPSLRELRLWHVYIEEIVDSFVFSCLSTEILE